MSDENEKDTNDGIEKHSNLLRNMYLYDPKAQDTINRMTYGVIMADMDVAWKYLGYEKPPTGPELKAMAAGEFSYTDKSPDAQEQKRAMAKKCLAKIHLEYNKVANGLLRLHQSINHQKFSDVMDGKEAADKLLATLPIALREQLTLSRDRIKQPRHELADLFMQMLVRDSSVDPKSVTVNSSYYKNTIYPAMGTLFECFEHTPRAYTRPKWVKETEPQLQLAA